MLWALLFLIRLLTPTGIVVGWGNTTRTRKKIPWNDYAGFVHVNRFSRWIQWFATSGKLLFFFWLIKWFLAARNHGCASLCAYTYSLLLFNFCFCRQKRAENDTFDGCFFPPQYLIPCAPLASAPAAGNDGNNNIVKVFMVTFARPSTTGRWWLMWRAMSPALQKRPMPNNR